MSLRIILLPVAIGCLFNGSVYATDLTTDECRDRLYVSNEDSGTISVIEAGSGLVIDTIPVGKRPRGIRVSLQSERLYVALSGSPKCPPWIEECDESAVDKSKDGIAELDLKSMAIRRILPGGSDPEQFAVDPSGRTLFVANEDAGLLSVVDIISGEVRASIVAGGEPEGVQRSPNGHWVYVASEADHTVTAIDALSLEIAKVFEVGLRPRDIVFAHRKPVAFVSSEIGALISVVDTKLHNVIAEIPLPGGARPVGMAISGDDRLLYVANGRHGSVSVIDTYTRRVVETVKVGSRPWGIALACDDQLLFTANGPSNDISVIETSELRLLQTISVGESPWGIAVSSNR